MSIGIVLGILLYVVVYFVFLHKPGECYECGKRFVHNDIHWKSKHGKSLCLQCHIAEREHN